MKSHLYPNTAKKKKVDTPNLLHLTQDGKAMAELKSMERRDENDGPKFDPGLGYFYLSLGFFNGSQKFWGDQ